MKEGHEPVSTKEFSSRSCSTPRRESDELAVHAAYALRFAFFGVGAGARLSGQTDPFHRPLSSGRRNGHHRQNPAAETDRGLGTAYRDRESRRSRRRRRDGGSREEGAGRLHLPAYV